jgi:hypothetical protein
VSSEVPNFRGIQYGGPESKERTAKDREVSLNGNTVAG